MALTTVDLSFPPTSLDYGSFLDLRQYLEHHSPIVPPEEDLTALGVWIGEQLFGDLRTLFWPRRALPALTVQVNVPTAAQDLLLHLTTPLDKNKERTTQLPGQKKCCVDNRFSLIYHYQQIQQLTVTRSEAMKFADFHGVLRHNPTNPRYFTDDTGKAIYLTGSHTWATWVDIRLKNDPPFDWLGFLDMAQQHGHNFMRLWSWDHPKFAPWTDDVVYFDPMPYQRTGPGLANDGLPKFDLTQFNPVYFETLRQRVIEAGKRGLYLAVMLFEGWCLKWSVPS